MRRILELSSISAACLWVFCLPTAARADGAAPRAKPASIQILALRSDDADEQAAALTAALRSRLRAEKRLADGDYSLEVLSIGLHCGDVPDAACQARIAEEVHADRYVWGIVHRVKGSAKVRAELHYWEKGQPPRATEVTYDEPRAGAPAGRPGQTALVDPLARVADDAVRALLPFAVATGEPARSAASEGASAGRAPSPGAAALVASSPRVNAARGPSPLHAGDLDAEQGESPAADGDHRAVGWGAIGLGAALIGAGAYSAYRVHAIDNDDSFNRYREGFHSGEDICQEASLGVSSQVAGAATPADAHHLCSQASTFQTLEFVFLGLGAVSLGAGIFFLATSHSAAPSGVTFHVEPRIARSGASLTMTVAGF